VKFYSLGVPYLNVALFSGSRREGVVKCPRNLRTIIMSLPEGEGQIPYPEIINTFISKFAVIISLLMISANLLSKWYYTSED
jgi:hypothetical protein